MALQTLAPEKVQQERHDDDFLGPREQSFLRARQEARRQLGRLGSNKTSLSQAGVIHTRQRSQKHARPLGRLVRNCTHLCEEEKVLA